MARKQETPIEKSLVSLLDIPEEINMGKTYSPYSLKSQGFTKISFKQEVINHLHRLSNDIQNLNINISRGLAFELSVPLITTLEEKLVKEEETVEIINRHMKVVIPRIIPMKDHLVEIKLDLSYFLATIAYCPADFVGDLTEIREEIEERFLRRRFQHSLFYYTLNGGDIRNAEKLADIYDLLRLDSADVKTNFGTLRKNDLYKPYGYKNFGSAIDHIIKFDPKNLSQYLEVRTVIKKTNSQIYAYLRKNPSPTRKVANAEEVINLTRKIKNELFGYEEDFHILATIQKFIDRVLTAKDYRLDKLDEVYAEIEEITQRIPEVSREREIESLLRTQAYKAKRQRLPHARELAENVVIGKKLKIRKKIRIGTTRVTNEDIVVKILSTINRLDAKLSKEGENLRKNLEDRLIQDKELLDLLNNDFKKIPAIMGTREELLHAANDISFLLSTIAYAKTSIEETEKLLKIRNEIKNYTERRGFQENIFYYYLEGGSLENARKIKNLSDVLVGDEDLKRKYALRFGNEMQKLRDYENFTLLGYSNFANLLDKILDLNPKSQKEFNLIRSTIESISREIKRSTEYNSILKKIRRSPKAKKQPEYETSEDFLDLIIKINKEFLGGHDLGFSFVSDYISNFIKTSDFKPGTTEEIYTEFEETIGGIQLENRVPTMKLLLGTNKHPLTMRTMAKTICEGLKEKPDSLESYIHVKNLINKVNKTIKEGKYRQEIETAFEQLRKENSEISDLERKARMGLREYIKKNYRDEKRGALLQLSYSGEIHNVSTDYIRTIVERTEKSGVMDTYDKLKKEDTSSFIKTFLDELAAVSKYGEEGLELEPLIIQLCTEEKTIFKDRISRHYKKDKHRGLREQIYSKIARLDPQYAILLGK